MRESIANPILNPPYDPPSQHFDVDPHGPTGVIKEGRRPSAHVLGIRPFRSQLLCEQVVGRGLRRRSYAVNDDGRFEPEYANAYGIPFSFIPSDRKL